MSPVCNLKEAIHWSNFICQTLWPVKICQTSKKLDHKGTSKRLTDFHPILLLYKQLSSLKEQILHLYMCSFAAPMFDGRININHTKHFGMTEEFHTKCSKASSAVLISWTIFSQQGVRSQNSAVIWAP